MKLQIIHRPASEHDHWGGGRPLVHVHYIHRLVHGNGIAIKVYGQILMAAKEVVFAREMKLNSIEDMLLTVKDASHDLYTANKWIYDEGGYDNYASIDIFTCDAYEMHATGVGSQQTHEDVLPVNGSIWLNFETIGE